MSHALPRLRMRALQLGCGVAAAGTCRSALVHEGSHSPQPHPTRRRYAPRDLTLLAYLLLSACIFLTRSLPLSALVLVLNVVNLTVCLALKGAPTAPLHCASHA